MQISKILIGVDDSKYAEYAASYGFDMARTLNAHVGLVHIVEPAVIPVNNNDTIMGMPFQENTIAEMQVLNNIQDEQSDNIIHRTAKKYGEGLQVTFFSEFGATANGILHCSKEFKADLVVLGTHSRSGIDRLLMGSVAESVVRNSEVPVLVVPMQDK